jgi:hypothetical protein
LIKPSPVMNFTKYYPWAKDCSMSISTSDRRVDLANYISQVVIDLLELLPNIFEILVQKEVIKFDCDLT